MHTAIFVYLFYVVWAAPGLRCCTRAPSSAEWGLLSSCGARQPLLPQSTGSGCSAHWLRLAGSRAQGLRCTGSAAPRHVESSPTRGGTCAPCIGRGIIHKGFPCGSAGKESTCSVGDLGSIPGLGRSPGDGKGYPLQYSSLENSMDCIGHGVAKSRTRLKDLHSAHLSTVPSRKSSFISLLASFSSSTGNCWFVYFAC